MTKIIRALMFGLIFLNVSCKEKLAQTELSSLSGKNYSNPTTVHNVKFENDQLIIEGRGLDSATGLRLRNSSISFDETFAIESKTNEQIMANGIRNMGIAVGAVMELIISSAHGASSYQVSFNLSDHGASDGDVLVFNASTSNWDPYPLNGMFYGGTHFGNCAPAGAGSLGEYLVMTDPSCGNIGDWLVYNGAGWDHIPMAGGGGGSGDFMADGSVPMSGALNLNGNSIYNVSGLELFNAFQVTIAPSAGQTANYVMTLPVDAGTSGQVLTTDGTGVLSWTAPAGGITAVTATAPLASTGGATPDISMTQSTSATDGYLSSADWNTFNNKENAITAGTSLQYFRGDKSWQALDSDAVAEGVSNFYFNDTRARGTTVGTFTATNSPIFSTDTFVGAFGKLQGQIDNFSPTWANVNKTTSSIQDIADVSTMTPTINDVLTWDGSMWAPQAAGSGAGDFMSDGSVAMSGPINFLDPMTAPSLSANTEGKIYFDSGAGKFKVSENGGSFVDLVGGPWTESASPTYLSYAPGGAEGVGIGVTAPAAGNKLHIFGDSTHPPNVLLETDLSTIPQLTLKTGTTATNASLGFINFSNGSTKIARIEGRTVGSGDGKLEFFTKPASNTPLLRMTIDPEGRVGIGTSVPNSELDVSKGGGAQILIRDTTNATRLEMGADINGANLGAIGGNLTFLTGGSQRVSIDSGGMGLIPVMDNAMTLGGTGNRWVEVHSVNGTIQTSDRRAKKNISESDLGLEFVNSLRPVSYEWREGHDEEKHYGLIAQELESSLDGKSFAGLNYDSNNDRYGVAYSELIAPVIKAVQELFFIFEDHESEMKREIASLKEENQKLKERLDKIEKVLESK